MKLTEFYENDAQRFWDPKKGMIGRDLHIYPLLKDMSGTVLEYGCGSGSLLLSLAKENRFSSLIGVDISETALKNIETAWADMEVDHSKLSTILTRNDQLSQVKSKSIDLVLSLDTIEHVLDPYLVIDELYRVASDDAIFVVSVPNYAYIKYVYQLFMGRQPITGSDSPVEGWRSAGWDGTHLHTFTKSSLEILLKDCGWEPISWSGYGDRFKFLNILRRKFPSFWSGAITAVCHKRKEL
jgi:SAM-dependent methyltransferase